MTEGDSGRGDEVASIIEVYLNIFNDLFSAFMQRGLDFAAERTVPYIEQVFKVFPEVFMGFRLELLELNYYILLENSRRVDKKEMFLGLQMLIKVMYSEGREILKDVRGVVSAKTKAAIMRNYDVLEEHGLLKGLPEGIIGFRGELKEVRLPYGKGFIEIDVPKDAEVLSVKKTEPMKDLALRLKAALKAPMGCEELPRIVGEGDRVALIIDDHTRRTPTREILPIVLEEIEKRTRNITLVVATGVHRRLTKREIREKVGDAKYPVVVHDASSNLISVGKMYMGTELALNSTVAEADFVLSIGTIEPHPYAGFSGGAKCILPGVAGRDAIVTSHLLNVYPGCAVGVLKGNPMREEIENAGKLANLRFIVNTVLGAGGEVLEVVCGDPSKAFIRGVEVCREAYTVEFGEKADIVIATPGGHPKDSTLYLSLRGLRTGELMLKEKGTIILVAKCEEHRGGSEHEKALKELLKGDPRDLISFSLLKKYNLVLVSEIGREGSTLNGVEVYDDPDRALRTVISRVGLDAGIILVPSIYVIPKMRISEKVQLATIMNSMEEGICIIDDAMKIQYMNPYLLKEFGMDAIGRSCFEVFAGLEQTCPGCRAGEEISLHKTETLEVSSNGKTYLVTHSPITNPDGSVMVLEILKDITERKKLDQELKKSEEKYRNLVEKMNDGLGVIDSLGRITFSNKRFAEMLEYRTGELVGKEVFSLFNEENKKVLKRELAKREGGESSVYEIEFTSKTGKQVPTIISATPLLDEKGNHIGSFAVVTDISERKKLERQLKEYSEHLEQMVEERTRELQRSNELKDLFTDIMRHDLLNPVGVIKGLSEFASMDVSPEERRRLIERIQGNARKLEAMIQSAATLAKVEAVEKLDFEEHDLYEILKGVISDFKPLLKEKGMKVKFEGKRRCPARVNPSIGDVFSNLLSNAIKYSPENTRITVGVMEEKGGWKVYVKDRGMGIPDKHKEAIFERFKRGGKKGVTGTGLGLAIAKRIVDLHKGRIWVDDNMPRGSVFYVTIPEEV